MTASNSKKWNVDQINENIAPIMVIFNKNIQYNFTSYKNYCLLYYNDNRFF